MYGQADIILVSLAYDSYVQNNSSKKYINLSITLLSCTDFSTSFDEEILGTKISGIQRVISYALRLSDCKKDIFRIYNYIDEDY